MSLCKYFFYYYPLVLYRKSSISVLAARFLDIIQNQKRKRKLFVQMDAYVKIHVSLLIVLKTLLGGHVMSFLYNEILVSIMVAEDNIP